MSRTWDAEGAMGGVSLTEPVEQPLPWQDGHLRDSLSQSIV